MIQSLVITNTVKPYCFADKQIQRHVLLTAFPGL
jgi:hypothetical protein